MTDKLVLVGHPFAPMGMGEHVRSSWRALKAAGLSPQIRDIYGLINPKDPDYVAEFGTSVVTNLSSNINIYHINGDEVAQSCAHMERETPSKAYKIIYPAWELSKYPAEWAKFLDRFDEIWAPSKFIYDSLTEAVSRPVILMPLACELKLSNFLDRRHFAIRESSFVFFFMFDFTSYIERKNPFAVIEAYNRFYKKHPFADTCLVLKVNSPHERADDFNKFLSYCQSTAAPIDLIKKSLSDNEIKNLIRNCDCFLSLHRSEGFGRGLSEAMLLGKPVIGTSYGGNTQFTTPENSCPVGYKLIPVPDGQYPFSQGQVWADPDIDEAVEWMTKLFVDRDLCRRIGQNARRHMRQHFSYRAVGVRYVQRLEQIMREKGQEHAVVRSSAQRAPVNLALSP